MEAKFIKRFESFVNSLNGLRMAKERDAADPFVLSGTVQKYNLTFDISWKVMKDIIVQQYMITNFVTGSPREVLKQAKGVDLISDDIWVDMLNDRNELAHDYDGKLASECFELIVNDYINAFDLFKEKAETVIAEMKEKLGESR